MLQITSVSMVAVLLGVSGLASAEPLLPWQLRPLTARNSIRAESAIAVFNDANGNVNITSTNALSASYHLTDRWAPMLRLGFVGNNAPGAARDGITFANPVAGVTYTRASDNRRVALFAAATLPIGSGGGDDADPTAARANAASITARPADDAMFEVNYMTGIVGADISYVRHGFTAQAEATLQQSVRVRGAHSAHGTDPFRTRAALGAHVGTFIGSHVSLGGDLLYQRWVSHPTKLDAMTAARVPIADADMAALTMSLGVRMHFHVGTEASIHPGISYTRGLDATGPTAGSMITNRTSGVAIDVPVLF